ncbi:MAG TPA: N-acetylornithine carbamoyltransferase [Chitinophagales bacterium]|nr:N-acetylornithine carbamoyltransferase [Chitinophagales bacterium]
MKNFISVKDAGNLDRLIKEALEIKAHPGIYSDLGKGKTIGLLFLNPSLRTRMSSQRAAFDLGMSVMVLNLDKDSWQIEFEDGAVMNSTKSEHIREAAAVIAQYCDVVGIRCFPGLVDKEKDYSEQVLNSFMKYCTKPVVSLESATRHPLQSFADVITIAETSKKQKPKVVLTWAPHIKALPQAVPNSFAEWAVASGAEVVITQPEGYELDTQFSEGAKVEYNQNEALKNADYVYVKNWSSFNNYGAIPEVKGDWLLTPEKLALTANAGVMHCLPVRRNIELLDAVIDGPNSLIQQQAGNRVIAAKTVFKKILENIQA